MNNTDVARRSFHIFPFTLIFGLFHAKPISRFLLLLFLDGLIPSLVFSSYSWKDSAEGSSQKCWFLISARVFLPLLIFAVNGVLRQCASNIVQGDHLSRMSGHDQTKWDREWVRQDCSHQRLSQLRFALENSLNKSLCICTTSLCDSMTSLVNLKRSRRFTQKATCEVEGRHDRSVCHSTRCSECPVGSKAFTWGRGGGTG